MKKNYIILVIIVLVGISITTLFISNKTILTNKSSNIDKIVVSTNELDEKGSIEFTNQEDILEMVKVIQQTKKITNVKFPKHSDSIQNDSVYDVEITYNNNSKDIIHFSENRKSIYRFLNTKGSSGDRGYVMGENISLYDFLKDKLAKNKT